MSLRLIYPPDFPFPSTYVSVYGAKLSRYYYRPGPNTTSYPNENFLLFDDLESIYTSNSTPLRQNRNYEADESLGNIFEQSIVHYKIGVIPNNQQVNVIFKYATPPGLPNKIQIFKGEELVDSFTSPLQYDWYEGTHATLLTGDGRTSIDMYFRPSSYIDGCNPMLFFKGIDMEVI